MKIDWSDPSILDIENIREYISRDSKYYADKIVEGIIESVGNLATFPKMGRRVPEAEQENIREIFYSNYRIMYLIGDDFVVILAIIHGARDLTAFEKKPWNGQNTSL